MNKNNQGEKINLLLYEIFSKQDEVTPLMFEEITKTIKKYGTHFNISNGKSTIILDLSSNDFYPEGMLDVDNNYGEIISVTLENNDNIIAKVLYQDFEEDVNFTYNEEEDKYIYFRNLLNLYNLIKEYEDNKNKNKSIRWGKIGIS